MNKTNTASLISLSKNALVSIARPLGCRIDCVQGAVWVTHDGDPRDLFILAGEQHIADQRPRMLVQALESVVVRITAGPA